MHVYMVYIARPHLYLDSRCALIDFDYKQTEEKKSTLRCAPSLLFSHGEKTRHHAKRRCARWISSLGSIYSQCEEGAVWARVKVLHKRDCNAKYAPDPVVSPALNLRLKFSLKVGLSVRYLTLDLNRCFPRDILTYGSE